MSVIIAGASGHLGRLTAELLPDAVLVTRSPESIVGREARTGDYGDTEALKRAFEGGTRLLMISASAAGDHDPVPLHENAIAAAREAGIEHVVFTSFANPSPENPAFPGAPNRASEEALRQSGLTYTILRNAIYADFRAVMASHYLAEGRWITNMGAGRHAFIWRSDCAKAAAAALTTDGHENQTYEVTGPELIGVDDFVDLMEELGGRRVVVDQVDDETYDAYHRELLASGVVPPVAEYHWTTGKGIREGHMSQLTTAFEKLTGERPRGMRELRRKVRSWSKDATAT
jgi:NAD(P)H dehydrogenase (quinone)